MAISAASDNKRLLRQIISNTLILISLCNCRSKGDIPSEPAKINPYEETGSIANQKDPINKNNENTIKINKNKSCPSNEINKDSKTIKSVSFKDNLKFNILAALILKRGISSTNCKWWNINDFIMKDKTGLEAYREIKKKIGTPKLAVLNLLGKDIYVVNDIEYVKYVLDNSPKIFGAGKFKALFFKSFMENNVGLSPYSEWQNRRKLNEEVLNFTKMPFYAEEYNIFIQNEIKKGLPLVYQDFNYLGKKIVSKVVFNDPYNYPKEIYSMFDESNQLSSVLNKKFSINEDTLNIYINYVEDQLKNPKDKSLLKLVYQKLNYCKKEGKTCRNEIMNQVPHWMFPMLGALDQLVPKVLLFLAKHPEKLENLKKEILSIDSSDTKSIFESKYLRYCVLESIRLNPLSISLLRVSNEDFEFPDGNKLQKGEDFIVLFSPYLRNEDEFHEPNKFIPERWQQNKELENSYYTLMFSQGKQRCPGKDLAIFLMKSVVFHYLKISDFKLNSSTEVDNDNIDQMINPCKVKFI